ncbi:MAG: polymerase [Treponema sp.]|nr:polymerase [Treponema sp.]
MRKRLVVVLTVCCALGVHGQTLDIAGAVEWETMEIAASVALNLASAGIRLPTGRAQAEELVDTEYPRLIRPSLLSIPVDSSSFLQDLIDRGEFSLQSTGAIAQGARRVPPALSADLSSLTASYTIDLTLLSAALVRHSRPVEPARPLRPLPTAAYTGIIILAAEALPIQGRNAAALAQPCLFPKVWDADMNLIYERNMMDTDIARRSAMIRYVSSSSVFRPTPSGLSPELAALVGNNPLRIIARGVYGIRPTDPIIDREDALLILSSEENLRLLREGRVAIMLDKSVLSNQIAGSN